MIMLYSMNRPLQKRYYTPPLLWDNTIAVQFWSGHLATNTFHHQKPTNDVIILKNGDIFLKKGNDDKNYQKNVTSCHVTFLESVAKEKPMACCYKQSDYLDKEYVYNPDDFE